MAIAFDRVLDLVRHYRAVPGCAWCAAGNVRDRRHDHRGARCKLALKFYGYIRLYGTNLDT